MTTKQFKPKTVTIPYQKMLQFKQQQQQFKQQQQYSRVKPKPQRKNNGGLMAQYRNRSSISNVPKISRGTSKGSVIISNSEFFSSIVAPDTSFHIMRYPIQPGIGILFPWLSSIANSFDGYKILNLRFEFKTNSGTGNTGHVVMGVDYDSHDVIPVSEQELTQNTGATPHSIWEASSFQPYDVSKNGFYNKHFTRAGDMSGNVDIKTYDSGNFLFGYISGTTINIGTLWVHYTIELFNPQQGVVPGGEVKLTTVDNGVDVTHTMGTSWNDVTSDPLAFPFEYTGPLVGTFTIPFEGIITWYCVGTIMTDLAITSTATVLYDNAVLINGAATGGIDRIWLRAQPGDTITFTPTATTVTQCQYYAGSVKPSQITL